MRSFEEEIANHARKMAVPFSSGETTCGYGSTLAYTGSVREELPKLLKRLGVTLLNDAGCGDGHWIGHIDLPCQRRGFDLHHGERLDIATQAMPAADAILCRDVLIHMRGDLIGAALELFKQSAPTLIATGYEAADHSALMEDRSTRYIDLGREPFGLLEVERIPEDVPGKFLGVYAL